MINENKKEFLAIICVTEEGHRISENIKKTYNAHVYRREEVKKLGIKEVTKIAFESYNFIIFISSTGIAVRSIAPYVKSKTEDPGILVIDNSSNYVISLLSGHIGGANELTESIAKILNARAIITTATDNLGLEAPDMVAKKNNLVIDNMKTCKDVAAFLVHGYDVGFLDEEGLIDVPKGYIPYNHNTRDKVKALILVTNKDKVEDYGIPVLKLIKKNIVLGIGCKKDYPENKIMEKTFETLRVYNIDKRAIKAIGTAWVKAEERAIITLSKNLNCEMRTFTKEEIQRVHLNYKGSDFVEKNIGVRAVCEPSVELLGGNMITDKLSLDGMTLCIGVLN